MNSAEALDTRFEAFTRSIPSDFTSPEGEALAVPVNSEAPGIFLIDIDGTLLNARGIHGPSMIATFKKVFGDNAISTIIAEVGEEKLIDDYVQLWGKGDKEEFRILAISYGLMSETPVDAQKQSAQLDKLAKLYSTTMAETIQELYETKGPTYMETLLLPGVRPFLEAMRRRGIPASLVTGNNSKTAAAMMRYFDLGKYFISGGYDDDRAPSDNQPPIEYPRAQILKKSVRRLRAKLSAARLPEALFEHALVIGDTPSDLAATGYDIEDDLPRMHALLIATGSHAQQKLLGLAIKGAYGRTTHRPALAVKKLSDLKLDAFFNSLTQDE